MAALLQKLYKKKEGNLKGTLNNFNNTHIPILYSQGYKTTAILLSFSLINLQE
jgi:hypothetical protein